MYQVLYRKWRSQTFSDIYGQDAIVAALKGEMTSGRLAHAYLFTGPRGTGKTSCAKILAKAVNCLNPRDGDPCNECDNCRGIDSGTILDVVEIDAASNNGVDNIRDLREEVGFTPAIAKYRVYIIDEVHMLSTAAFNALLKTLEEPPAHVVFILATTEAHKLPATILSRCQRFDFNRIAPDTIAARIRYIAGQEAFTVADDAAMLIARLADGGMRDALSLLDQCVSVETDITVDTVTRAAGIAGRDHLFALSAAVRDRDGAAALSLIGQLYGGSKDMERLCAELIGFYRNLMILKSVAEPGDMIVLPPDELAQMKGEAGRYDLPAILHAIDALQRALERLKYGASRRTEMEMALLRLCSPEMDADPAALSSQIAALSQQVTALTRRVGALESAPRTIAAAPSASAARTGDIPANAAVPPAVTSNTDTAAAVESAPASPAGNSAAAETPVATAAAGEKRAGPLSAPEDAPETPFDDWSAVLETLADTCPPIHGVLIGSRAVFRGEHVLIAAANPLFRELVVRDGNKAALSAAIQSITGRVYRIGIKKDAPPAEAAAAGGGGGEPDDPLAKIIQNSRALGVDVEIRTGDPF